MDEKMFDFTMEGKEDTLLKKAKAKSRLRMIFTSTAVAVGVVGLGIALKMQVTPYILNKEVKEVHMYHQIYGANVQLGQWEKFVGLTERWARTVQYKIVDGVVVPIGEVRIPKGRKWHENTIANNQGDLYGVNGHRIMRFYHPELGYGTYSNDLSKLKEVAPDKVVELGISFNKGYTVQEVDAMMPEGINLQWSWIDTYDEVSLQEAYKDREMTPWKEDEVVGIHYLEPNGKEVEKPVDNFMMDLETAIRSSKKDSELYESMQTRIEQEGLRVLGVVVTGSPEVLQQLEGKPFVKATTFGTIVERY
ncbi:MAG: anti sigma factor C-terminal domain-containing protein [Cellulosilyticaceae bacterium]